MICKQCNAEILEGNKFCPICGAKVDPETEEKYCQQCGCKIEDNVKFCPKCGKSQLVDVQQNNTPINDQQSSSKIFGAYFVSIISAAISLIIRLTIQDTYYSWSNLLDNRKVVGINQTQSRFLTAIPVIAAIIVTLMIVTDKRIVNAEKSYGIYRKFNFIALAVLFIWFDLPYSIIDL